MFGIGPVEFIILVVIGIVVFGPERLPEAAKKAALMIRQVRQMANNARNDLADELGPEFRDLELEDLRNPRRAVQKYVLDGMDEDDVRVDKDLDIRKDVDLSKDLEDLDGGDSDRPARRRNGRLNGTRAESGSRDDEHTDSSARTSERDENEPNVEDAGEDRATLTLPQDDRPPFDPDAT